MNQPARQLYQFGPFHLDTAERSLIRDGKHVTLTPKAFDALITLVENSGHLVSRDELMKAVWPDTFIDDHTLTQTISAVRKALDEGRNGDKYIETVPRRGYRFVADVQDVANNAELIWRRRTLSQLRITEEVHENGSLARATLGLPLSVSWRRIAFVALAAVILLSGVWLSVSRFQRSRHRSEAQVARNIKSIAVLPFKTLGGQEDDYLKLGLADALITRLGALKQITVRPTAAVEKFAAEDQDRLAAGRALNVDAVLDGRVQKLGERIRMTVQLLNTQDGTPLWTDKFDGQFTDIFAVQDRLADHLARAMVLNLSSEEKARLAKRYTENPEAYQLYLKGRYFWNKRTTPDFEKASTYFQRAITLDNNYAPAYAGLADCYSFLRQMPKAKEAVLKALSLDDTLAEAHASLGNLRLFTEWNLAEAESEFKRAINLNPNYATAHHWYAFYFAATGQLDEALAEIKRAQEIDPLSLIINTDLGEMLYFARQYDEAIEQLRKTIEMDSSFINAHYALADVYLVEGRYQEAIGECLKINHMAGTNLDGAVAKLAVAFALSGNRIEANKEMKEFIQDRAVKPEMSIWIALIYAALGERDQAFKSLVRLYDEKGAEIIYLKVNPMLDSLRSDPRYADLLRRMNLPS